MRKKILKSKTPPETPAVLYIHMYSTCIYIRTHVCIRLISDCFYFLSIKKLVDTNKIKYEDFALEEALRKNKHNITTHRVYMYNVHTIVLLVMAGVVVAFREG